MYLHQRRTEKKNEEKQTSGLCFYPYRTGFLCLYRTCLKKWRTGADELESVLRKTKGCSSCVFPLFLVGNVLSHLSGSLAKGWEASASTAWKTQEAGETEATGSS